VKLQKLKIRSMRKGFTLIELLIVITIVGVITALTFVALNAVRGKSRDSKRVADIRQWQAALEMYKNDNNVYPSAATSGQPLVGITNGYTYMKKVPSAPGTNDGTCTGTDAYTYTSSDPSNTYNITYCLGGSVQSAGPSNCSAVPGQICLAGGGGGGGPTDTGWVNPTSVVDDNTGSIGTYAWTNPSNAIANGGGTSYAGDMIGAGTYYTHYLKANTFGFNLPSTAVVDGIMVQVVKYDNEDSGRSYDYKVRLVKNNVIGSTDKSNGSFWQGNIPQTVSYGGPVDKWGDSWTYSDINNANFGFVIAGQATLGAILIFNFNVDEIKMKVYYH